MKIKKKPINKKLWQITAKRIKAAKRKVRDEQRLYDFWREVTNGNYQTSPNEQRFYDF